jgi:hypothetical protein
MRISSISLFTASAFLLTITIGCKRRLSPAEVKDNLEKAMTAYLMKEQQRDSTHFRFKIEDVEYSDGKEFYDCKFKVHLFREEGGDTTGIINGKVSRDFNVMVAPQVQRPKGHH